MKCISRNIFAIIIMLLIFSVYELQVEGEAVAQTVNFSGVVTKNGSENVRTYHRNVLSGKETIIDRVFNINPDCSLRAEPEIRVTQGAYHGEFKFVRSEEYPDFPSTNTRAACNQKKLPALSLDYIPAQNFRGTDQLSFEVFNEAGSTGIRTIIITIE